METAISVPDDVYGRAEAAANRLGLNRSQLYTAAVREFLISHPEGEDPVTTRLNAIADDADAEPAPVDDGRLVAGQLRALIDAGGWEW